MSPKASIAGAFLSASEVSGRASTGQGVGTHAVADEDAVDEVVTAVDDYDGDCGERELDAGRQGEIPPGLARAIRSRAR
jgi:hypothetical protein